MIQSKKRLSFLNDKSQGAITASKKQFLTLSSTKAMSSNHVDQDEANEPYKLTHRKTVENQAGSFTDFDPSTSDCREIRVELNRGIKSKFQRAKDIYKTSDTEPDKPKNNTLNQLFSIGSQSTRATKYIVTSPTAKGFVIRDIKLDKQIQMLANSMKSNKSDDQLVFSMKRAKQ